MMAYGGRLFELSVEIKEWGNKIKAAGDRQCE
jgi:hypothetical protein